MPPQCQGFTTPFQMRRHVDRYHSTNPAESMVRRESERELPKKYAAWPKQAKADSCMSLHARKIHASLTLSTHLELQSLILNDQSILIKKWNGNLYESCAGICQFLYYQNLIWCLADLTKPKEKKANLKQSSKSLPYGPSTLFT